MLPLDARNVLVCLRYGIGDVVMELPALSALREALPDAHITAIASQPAEELLEGDRRVDRVVLASTWGIGHRWDRADPQRRARIAEWAAHERFDLILDVGHAPAGISRGIWQTGAQSLESDGTAEREAVRSGRSGIEAVNASIRAGWGLDLSEQRAPELRLRPHDRDFASGLFHELGIEGESVFGVSPVASHELKRWPVDRFAAVADHIVERTGGTVLVLEGPQTEQGAALVESMEHAGSARRVGSHHLLRTAALLERCRGLVCNDTGLMHIAAAVAVPVAGVFGPTRAAAFLPCGPRNDAAEPADLDCGYRRTESLSPPKCWKAGHCLIAGRSCIHRTPLEHVLRAVDGWLESSEQRRTRGPARPAALNA